MVEASLAENGFAIREIRKTDEWCCIAAVLE